MEEITTIRQLTSTPPSPGSATDDPATVYRAVRQAADQGLPRDEAADLVRVEGGFTVTCTYWPSLQEPAGATVCVLLGDRVIDRLEVPPEQAHATWAHTAYYSAPYAAALRGE